jgi:rhodanese-related sulfurtransferase
LIEPLPPAELQAWLADTSRSAPLILDVREQWEYDICRIPGAQSMPMQEIPARWKELPQETDIVVVCHHGMRSLEAANYLRQAGFSRLYNLSGGVAAWADQADPAMPRY